MANGVDGRQLARFLAAGCVAVATDIGLYAVFRTAAPAAAAKAASFMCASAVAYLLNNFWVFPQGQATASGATRFVLANTLMMGVNVLTNGAVLAAWPGAVAPALITATAVTSALSYVVFKWWVFRSLPAR